MAGTAWTVMVKPAPDNWSIIWLISRIGKSLGRKQRDLEGEDRENLTDESGRGAQAQSQRSATYERFLHGYRRDRSIRSIDYPEPNSFMMIVQLHVARVSGPCFVYSLCARFFKKARFY